MKLIIDIDKKIYDRAMLGDFNITAFDEAVRNGTPLAEKTGHWIDADGDNAICDCCNRLNHLYGDYCKHCGAKMVEPQDSEKINCKYTKCENCINRNYCDFEAESIDDGGK